MYGRSLFHRVPDAPNSLRSILEQVASALNRRDYPTAAKLIAALVAQRLDTEGKRESGSL